MSPRRLSWALALLASVVLAALAGTARAGTFGFSSFSSTLPSSTAPNLPGSLTLPPGWTSPPSVPEQRSYAELQALWQRAGATYGVPWQVLAAIDKIESDFGRNMGPSSAGAIGWMQFMPSTWLSWGTDADGDGVASPWDASDAIYSAARYLAAAGGQTDIRRAIFAYNHADWYVNEVLQLAALFGNAGAAAAPGLAQQGASLQQAEQDVAATNSDLVSAQKAERKTRRAYERLAARLGRQTLLSDRLAAQRVAVLAGVRHDRAATLVHRLENRLRTQETALASARAGTTTTSFSQGGGPLLGAPSYSSGYVFPVGGGPDKVSVSHGHHDYPAVDIAAPEGSPEYAFTDIVVVKTYRYSEGRCGIGMTVHSGDGREWTYCHMSYLEPSVVPGAALAAGAPVGLVGSTGHATGPHLHLQLNPPTSYPQQEAWFQAFAGRAFRWSDAPTPNLDAAAVQPLNTLSAAPARPLPAPSTPAPATPAPASAAPVPHDVFAVVPTPRARPAGHVVQFTAGG